MLAGAAALTMMATAVQAGTGTSGKMAPPPPPIEEPEPKVVSGTLSLAVNTHFILYGLDVWGAGSSWDDILFNPSIELSLDLGGGFSFILGTWWDVNDNAESNIDNIQEIDVYAGFGYSVDKWSFTLLYQEWLYASQSERIVDFIVGYDTFLNPSLTVHGRVDNGFGGDNGVVFVLGVSEGFEAGSVSFNFPLNVGFATDGFHGGDGGFAYASLALEVGVPLTFLPGDWSLDGALTGYYTYDEVIPTNPDDLFATGTIGLTLSF